MENLNIKEEVKKKYSEIAKSKSDNCCATTCCEDETKSFNEDYTNLDGYVSDADFGLGCGIPVNDDTIQKGDTVIDLGCGAGNDVFIARKMTGESGNVVGIDFTDDMLLKAEENRAKLGYQNVKFIKGDIENIPLENNYADVVISNCVLNLVPDKEKAFNEIYRILKPGGQFSISDIVLTKELPQKLQNLISLYTGCITGALLENKYLDIISNVGFKNIKVLKEKYFSIDHEIAKKHLGENSQEEIENLLKSIKSVTISGTK